MTGTVFVDTRDDDGGRPLPHSTRAARASSRPAETVPVSNSSTAGAGPRRGAGYPSRRLKTKGEAEVLNHTVRVLPSRS